MRREKDKPKANILTSESGGESSCPRSIGDLGGRLPARAGMNVGEKKHGLAAPVVVKDSGLVVGATNGGTVSKGDDVVAEGLVIANGFH